MLGGGDIEGRLTRVAGFGLGVPLALKTSLRTIEGAGNVSKTILNGLVKSAPSIASQSNAGLLRTLINNHNKNKSN